MTNLPEQADVVIIGQGGIVGASVAHHLIEQGWGNIVGLEKSAVPSDISSTAHASDFCYMTSHDRMSCYTTIYSRKFYESLGHYSRVGGLEVARVGDDERMAELERKVGSGKAFGTRVSLITAADAKQRFPLLDEDVIQGAMWDPDAGLVVPRSQRVAGVLIEQAVASGRLQAFANTPALGIDVQDGRICGVQTRKGMIRTSVVVLCAGIWGPPLAEMGGVQLPLMPFEHPLLFFSPFDEFAGTGKQIGYPLFRDQGNSSYMRDTGDPRTAEGGKLEWGYYEQAEPRLVYSKDIAEPEHASLSPSMRDLSIEQVMDGYERALEIIPALGELGWDEKSSFNGLMSISADGGSLLGESPETRGLWLCEAVWVKDGPGMGKVLADWMTHGKPELDPFGIDIARFYPVQKTSRYVYGRACENAQKIYNPAVHPREPYINGRDLRRSPFWPREKELGGYFMEAAGWERAHGYAANEQLLATYGDRVPERANEWDARHFWRVSNAEHLKLSDDVGMINLSHFAIFDIFGPDAEKLLEYLAVARVGGSTPVGKGVYTHFLDADGGIHSDLTIIRLAADRYRVVCGGDTGHRDLVWIQRMCGDSSARIEIEDRTDSMATLGLWGPNARSVLQSLADDPEALAETAFPFASARDIRVRGMPVWAFRISYVGELGWELYMPFSYGLAIWDLLFAAGVTPVGIETYANTRRLEKSLRLQNVDLLTEYNLYEADLARPRVKSADFHGKAAYLAQREREHQPAYLCTMTMLDNIDANGIARYPVGQWPILDPETGEVPVDDLGRRSYANSVVYGPSIGRNIALGYLPWQDAYEGRELILEYFGQHYPVRVEAVGYRALYDPDNTRLKSPSLMHPSIRSSHRAPLEGLFMKTPAPNNRIDGKALATRVQARLTRQVETLAEHGIVPCLAVVWVGTDPASQVYVRHKRRQAGEVGIQAQEYHLSGDTSEAVLLDLVRQLNEDSTVHGILVQLPLPAHISTAAVVAAVEPDKDVDGFHAMNIGRLWRGDDVPAPCTAMACRLLLNEVHGDDLAGLHAVVVGRSNIVGKPLANLLLRADCTVTMAHSRTRDLPAVCRTGDILIAAVGSPKMIRGNWIKPGATVIDVGINRIEDPSSDKSRLVGDVAFQEAADIAGAITPVPGGVGPMTIACLLDNTVAAADRQQAGQAGLQALAGTEQAADSRAVSSATDDDYAVHGCGS